MTKPLQLPAPLMKQHAEVVRLQGEWAQLATEFKLFFHSTPEVGGYDYAQHDVLKRRAEIAEERYRVALGDYFNALNQALLH